MRKIADLLRFFLLPVSRGLSFGRREVDSWARGQIVEMARLGGRLLI